MTSTAHALTGALDMARARALYALALEVAREADDDVIFDCTEVDRIDAAGAQILIALARALEGRGLELELVGVRDAVFARLAAAGLAGVLLLDIVRRDRGEGARRSGGAGVTARVVSGGTEPAVAR